MMEPLKCRCGADARVRVKKDTAWVECKKKCGMHSGYFKTVFSPFIAEQAAIEMWNRTVSKNG